MGKYHELVAWQQMSSRTVKQMCSFIPYVDVYGHPHTYAIIALQAIEDSSSSTYCVDAGIANTGLEATALH